MTPVEDPFDDIINLEQRFYQQGYEQGVADGEQAGRIEGRQFGMSKGFEKFFESGRLAGKTTVWASRLPEQRRQQELASNAADSQANSATTQDSIPGKQELPLLSENARLAKNIKMLYALVEPETLSTENSDEAVQDFDDRVKRAQGKAKVVERMLN